MAKMNVRPDAGPLEAAKVVCAMLRRRHGCRAGSTSGPQVWDRDAVVQHGWDDAQASVYWEGGPSEWAVALSLDPEVIDAFPGVLIQPYSGWLLSFHVHGAVAGTLPKGAEHA